MKGLILMKKLNTRTISRPSLTRQQFADDSPIRIPCEGCGAMIQAGRFCEKCKAELANGFKQTMMQNKPAAPEKKQKKSDGDKMRFLK